MSENYIVQLDYLLRIFIAALCGLAIGYERKNRMKEAGLRTHFIVAIAAALIMIVSKYGFQDQLGLSNIALDPSRMAAQVVTGVGFLGAGIIFTKKQNIIGLTTAAGVWATAGIAMAIGSGLYFIGLSATVLIILGQIVLHGKIKWLSSLKTQLLILQVINEPGNVKRIQEIFEDQNITILNFKSKINKDSIAIIDIKVIIKVYESFNNMNLLCVLQDNPNIKSVEF